MEASRPTPWKRHVSVHRRALSLGTVVLCTNVGTARGVTCCSTAATGHGCAAERKRHRAELLQRLRLEFRRRSERELIDIAVRVRQRHLAGHTELGLYHGVDARGGDEDIVATTAGAVLSEMARRGLWEAAVAELLALKGAGVVVRGGAFGAIASICSKRSSWMRALAIVEDAKWFGLELDLVLRNTVLSALGQGSRWESAAEELHAAELSWRQRPHKGRSPGIVETVDKKNAKETLVLDAGSSAAAQLVLRMGRAVRADAVSYAAAATASVRGAAWGLAVALLVRATDGSVRADEIALGSFVAACGTANKWRTAVVALGWRQARCNTVACNSAITACERSQEWPSALSLLVRVRRQRFQPDIVTYNAGASACADGHKWRHALILVDGISQHTLRIDAVSRNAAVTACEKSLRWPWALVLLRHGLGRALEPNMVSCGSVLSGCESAMQWEQAAESWHMLRTWALAPDSTAFAATIAACGRSGAWEIAIAWLQGAGRIGLAIEQTHRSLADFGALPAAGACAHAGRPHQAGILLAQAKHSPGNHLDYACWIAAAASVAERANRGWRFCLGWLSTLQERRLHGKAAVDSCVALFRSAARACGCASKWAFALRVLAVAEHTADHEATAWSAAAWACESGGAPQPQVPRNFVRREHGA